MRNDEEREREEARLVCFFWFALREMRGVCMRKKKKMEVKWSLSAK